MRPAVRLVLTVVVTLGVAGPSLQDRSWAAPGPTGALTVYTSESEDDVNLLAGDFMRRTPGVTVKIFRAGTGPVEAKVEAERQAGRVQADVLWFADIGFLRTLARQGALLAFAPPSARGVDRQFHYAGNQIHEVRLIFNVVAFNTNHVRFRPTSWKDLTLPRYRGRVGIPNPFISGAAFAHVGTFASLREFGWDYYRKLRENNTLVLSANGDVIQKLASGEISIATVVDFFVRFARAQGSPVDYIVPVEGAMLVPTPIGIIKTSGNPEAARAFVDYLYTPEAQRLFVQRSYIPVLPGVTPPAGAPGLAGTKIIPPNLEYIDQHREEIKKTFSSIFGLQ